MEASPDPLMLASLPKVTDVELRGLQRECIRLMRLEDDKFPGSQPVSFERRHLAPEDEEASRRGVSLLKQEFYAAEKTDGVRYMLLILGERGAFMVDRNFEMRRLPAAMRFPSRKPGAPPVDNTLLDGELVEDAEPDGKSSPRMRYLAYDACCVCGACCTAEPLTHRLMRARREVLAPRYALAASAAAAAEEAGDSWAASATSPFAEDPFTVALKDMFSVPQLPHIFKNVHSRERMVAAHGEEGGKFLFTFQDPLRKLSHGNDGIIFTPVVNPYEPGTCQSLLKWKPANMNSIDFRVKTVWRTESDKPGPQPRFQIMVADKTTLIDYDWITFSDELHAKFAADSRADERIIECVYDPKHETIMYDPDQEVEPTWDFPRVRLGGWKYERVREDKKLPNDIKTVESIKVSVRDGVTQPELLHRLGIAQVAGRGFVGL